MAATDASSTGPSKKPHPWMQAYSAPERFTPSSRIGCPCESTSALPATCTAGAAAPLFAPNSFWNAPLPSTAPIDASSPARTAAVVSEVNSEMQQRIGPWIDERSNSTPFYVVGADQPRVHVTLDSTIRSASTLRSALSGGVPIPAGAQAAAGGDAHMTVYQPSTDTMWEFYHASSESDGWHAD